jgi:hypothetical protein
MATYAIIVATLQHNVLYRGSKFSLAMGLQRFDVTTCLAPSKQAARTTALI